MKIFVVNRKRLGVTIIIIGLMVVIYGIYQNFYDNIKYTALMQDGAETTKEYNINSKNISFSIPEKWDLKEDNYESKEILYKSNIKSGDEKIQGAVELWNLRGDINEVINKYIKGVESQNSISDLKKTEISSEDKKIFSVEYTSSLEDTEFLINEYYVPFSDTYMKISFFTTKNNFKANFINIYLNIVNSLKNQ